jgi:hypothetical protein
MSTHHHLLDLQVGNSILDYTRGVEVVGVYRIRNISVHKYVAGLAVADGGLRYATVSAAYPKDLGRLALCEFGEGVWVCLGTAPAVLPVSCDQVVERI